MPDYRRWFVPGGTYFFTVVSYRRLERHFDYRHFNPVKHEYVTRAADWPWSSFHRYVASGHYPAHWGREEPPHLGGLDFE